MAIELGKAYVQIVASTKGLQKSVAAEFKGVSKTGQAAGKDMGQGMSKGLAGAVKGKGKATGKELGDEAAGAVNQSFSTLKLGAIGGIFATVAQTALGSFGSIVSGAAEASDATDKFKTTLDFAGLDTSTIDKVTAQVQEYADKTVYGLGDIQSMTAQLASNGVKDYAALGEAAGNLNAVAGGNAETFKSVGMVMTQTAGAGKLTTENWNQLSDAIPGASGKIQQALLEAGAYTGNFRDAMAEGEITAEEFNDAVMKLGSEPVAVEAAQSTETFEGMLGNLQATVEGALAQAFNELKPVIGAAMDGIAKAAETVLPKFVDGVKVAADGMKQFGEWVQNNKNWVVPLAGVLGGLAGAYIGVSKAFAIIDTVKAAGGLMQMFKATQLVTNATRIWSGVTKIAAAAQGIFNATLLANPITWIVIGIAAVVAALVVFFTKTETGRKLWEQFTQALGTAWNVLKDTLAAGWEWLKTNVIDAFADGWNHAMSNVSERWEEIKEKFGALGEWFSTTWDSIKSGVIDLWQSSWQTLSDNFTAAMDGITSVWQSVTDGIGAAWDWLKNVLAAGWEFIKTTVINGFTADVALMRAAWEIVTGALIAAWESVKTGFHNAWQFINTVVFAPFKAAIGLVRAVFSGDTEQMKAAWENFKGSIANAVEMIKARLSNMMEHFRQIPGKIKSAFAGAGTWLLDAGRGIIRGLADGIRQMAGAVADAVRAVVPDNLERFVPGLHFGGLIPAFARGGVLPRVPGIPDSQRDPILGLNGQGVPIARVEPGEFIVNRESTKKYGRLLAAINAGVLDSRKGDWGLPRYASGGVIGYQDVIRWLKGTTVAGNPTPGPLDGAAYVWGGGLDGNWGDCSGTQSAVASIVAGVDATGRKFATGSQGAWLAANGFKRGRGPGKNAFETAFFNGGPGGGHTAGTLFGPNGEKTNVEMGGGRGNGQLGGPAAGSRDGQFTDIWWRELKPVGESASTIAGGAIKSTSVDGVTIEGTDGKTYSVDWGAADSLAAAWESGSERDRKLDEWEKRFGSFDQGGVLAGKGVFAKNTLSPERVLSPSQTKAFDELPKALYAQAASIDGLMSRLEWQKVGAEIGEGLEAKGRFGQSMLASVGRGDTLRAYAASMSLGDGVGLADRVGKLFGMDKIGSTLNPVVDAWTDMEDAAISQVDAADAIKQAEKNLADARKDGDKEAIKAAESELEKATGVAASAAAAVGQAQVAMALTVVETIVGLVEGLATWINDKIQAVFEGIGAAWAEIGDAFGSMAKLAGTVAKLRHEVSALTADWAMAQVELAAAFRNVRQVQFDGVQAQLEASVDLAEAQAAFDAQRKADMRAAAANYDDLSLAFDRFRWGMVGATDEFMDSMAAWSDKSHELWEKVLSAQVGMQVAEAQAREKNIEAVWKLTEAAFDLDDVTSQLGVAAQKLAVASGKAFGMGELEATVGQRYAKLAEELASIQADEADVKTWLNPVNWFNGYYRDTSRRKAEIRAELRELEARPEFAQAGINSAEVERLVSSAGAYGFFGAQDKIAALVANSSLGDAARALEQIDFENQLIDIKSDGDELRRKVEQNLAEVEYRKQLDPVQAEVARLEAEQASHETMAKYWASDNAAVRDALLRLAEVQEQGAKVVQVTGSNVSTDDLAVGLNQLGVRVERIENPKPDAAAVIAGRR